MLEQAAYNMRLATILSCITIAVNLVSIVIALIAARRMRKAAVEMRIAAEGYSRAMKRL